MEHLFKTRARCCAFLITILAILAAVFALHVFQRGTHEQEDARSAFLAQAEAGSGTYSESTLIVQNTTEEELRLLAEHYGAAYELLEGTSVGIVRLPEGVTPADLGADPQLPIDASKLVLDSFGRPCGDMVSGGFDNLSDDNLTRVNAKKAAARSKGAGITVALIDTGLESSETRKFAVNLDPRSYDVSSGKLVRDFDESILADPNGHGTKMASILAAAPNPEQHEDFSGLAPDVNLLVIKCKLDAGGNFHQSDVLVGMRHAIACDADIICFPMSFFTANNPFAELTQLAVDSDIICVAAAGNQETSTPCWPASDENVISAGSMSGDYEALYQQNKSDAVSLKTGSNYGDNTDLIVFDQMNAIGLKNEQAIAGGTSCSAVAVAGGLALYMSDANLKYAEYPDVRASLLASCIDVGELGNDWYCGFGALDVDMLVTGEQGTITFDPLTDELAKTKQVFFRGRTLQEVPEPERDYAVLDQWYYDINCLDEYDNLNDVLTQDLTVYARWENEDDTTAFRYTIENDEVTITQYVGKRRYLTIPSEIEGYPVTGIGTRAFAENTRLRGVVFPETLKRIDAGAFYRDTNLLTVTFPKSLETIGKSAFYECARLGVVAVPMNGDLKTVGDYAFAYCGRLSRFDVPAALESISGLAFYSDRAMVTVTADSANPRYYVDANALCLQSDNSRELVYYPAGRGGSFMVPENIQQIGMYAFAYSSVQEIVLPEGLREFGEGSFAYSALMRIQIPDQISDIPRECFFSCSQMEAASVGSGLKQIGQNAFNGCASLRLFTVAEGTAIEQVGQYAFRSCALEDFSPFEDTVTGISAGAFIGNRFRSLTLNKQLTALERDAFADCSVLESVTFATESTLKTLESGLFSGCSMLREIHLLEGIKAIGDNTFAQTAISEIHLPSTLQSVGFGAFSSCPNLEKIDAEEGKNFKSIDGVLYRKVQHETVSSALELYAFPCGRGGEFTVPDNVVRISGAAFAYNSRLTNVVFSPNLEVIDSDSFRGCVNLTSLRMPDSLVSLEQNAFAYCYRVENVTLNAGLQHIGAYAFENCSVLKQIRIPSSVNSIGSYAFNGDWSLENIAFEPDSQLHTLDQYVFSSCGITSIEIPASVSFISMGIFANCSSLQSVSFADNSMLAAVPPWVFRGANQITTVRFGENCAVETIQARAFENLQNLKSIDLENCPNLKNINNFAFQFCTSLEKIRLPASLKSIGRYAFYGCSGLTAFEIPEQLEHIGRYAFAYCGPADVLFSSAALPPMLDEHWDFGIRSYSCGTVGTVTSADGNWSYVLLNDGSATITAYRGNDAAVDLTQIDGHPVVSIGSSVFADNTTLRQVTLPEGLLSILDKAFAGTTALESVTIPSSLTYLGSGAFCGSGLSELNWAGNGALTAISASAFENTRSLKTLSIPAWIEEIRGAAFRASGLESVSFADSSVLKSIGDYAFAETRLAAISLPEQLERVGYHAFESCAALKNVTFPEKGALRIDGYAFYNSGLQQVYIPASVQYLGEYCFAFCNGMTAYTVSEDNKAYSSENGILFSRGGEKLLACPTGKTGGYTIPAHVKALGFGAFEGSRLSSVSFAEGSLISTIGLRAFYNAELLSEITLPKSLLSIDYYAFAYCENLLRVNLPADGELGGIYEGAFYHCSKLEQIAIPDSVVEISDRAFYGCESLKTLELGQDSKLAGVYDEAFAYTGITDAQLPESVQELGVGAFAHAKLASFTLPESLLLVEPGILEGCSNLEELSLKDLESIADADEDVTISYLFGREAFKSSDVPVSLKTIRLLNTTKVTDNLFRECAGIETVSSSLPIECIGGGAFFGCSGLKTLDLGDEITRIESYAFEKCTSLENLDFGASLKQIGTRAFYGCTSLASIGMEGVEEIGDRAFEACKVLQIASVPAKQIGAYAFYNCKSADISDLSNAEIIGDSAFENVRFNGDITIAHLKQIGSYAFQGSSGMTSLEVHAAEDAVLSQGAFSGFSIQGSFVFDGFQGELPSGFFNGYTPSLTLGDGITRIGDQAFSGCDVRDLTLPGTLREIGESAFYEADIACNLVLPDGLQKIGSYAFSRKSWINLFAESGVCSSFFIPDSVTEIGACAFQNCFELYFGAEAPLPGYSEACTGSVNDVMWGCDHTTSEDGVIYVTSGSSAYAFWNTDTSETIVLDTADGKPVRKVCTGAFFDSTNLKKLELGDAVETIGNNAFYACKVLKEVDADSALRTIGNSAFSENDMLSVFRFPEQNALETFGERAFYRYSLTGTYNTLSGFSFTNLTNLKRIEDEAFYNTRVGKADLSNCRKLEYVGERAFRYSTINALIFPDNYCGPIRTGLLDGTFVTEFTIPAGVTEIESGAFECNKKKTCYLRTVRFADGSQIETLETGVFKNARDLHTVILPQILKTIKTGAFENNGQLRELTIPVGVNRIEKDAFLNCKDLVVVFLSGVLPPDLEPGWNNTIAGYKPEAAYRDSETGLGYNLAEDGVSAIVVDCQGEHDVLEIDTVDGHPVREVKDALFQNNRSLKRLVIGPSVQKIGKNAFDGCTELTEVQFAPGGTAVVGDSAFQSCRQLQRADLSGAAEIGKGCFNDCSALKEVNIGNQIRVIPQSAFEEDAMLETVTMGDQVSEILNYAFRNCTSICRFDFPEELIHVGKDVFSENGLTETENGFHYFGTILYGADSITPEEQLVIRDDTTLIADESVSKVDVTQVKIFRIPDHVIGVGNKGLSFSNCRNIVLEPLPASLKWIGNRAFAGMKNETLVIPPTVEVMRPGCLSGFSSLRDLTIPYIGFSAEDERPFWDLFSNEHEIQNLRSVTVTGDVHNIQSFSSQNGNCAFDMLEQITFLGKCEGKVVNSAFACCTNLKSVTLPEDICEIGDNAFSGCTSLEAIQLPNNLKSIGFSAFSGCTGLTKLVIPGSVTSVGSHMLAGCSSLTWLETPCAPGGSMGAFYGIDVEVADITGERVPDYLKTVVYTPSDPTVIPDSLFKKMESLEQIIVPEETKVIERHAFYDCKSLKTISPMPNLNTIGAWAFHDCTNLNLNWANEMLEHLHEYAYANTGIRYMEVPEHTLSCGNSICYCADLEQVYFRCPLSHAFRAIGPETPKLKTIIIDNADGVKLTTVGIPASLETVVLTDKVESLPENFMQDIKGVTIYCQREEGATGWPDGWNNGNKVVYKDNWQLMTFCVDGAAIKFSMQKNSSVIQIPARSQYIKEDDNANSYTFLGWDVDHDGKVDNLLSVSGSVVKAEAVYSVTPLIGAELIDSPVITKDTDKTVISGGDSTAKKIRIDAPADAFETQTQVVLGDVVVLFDAAASETIRNTAGEQNVSVLVDKVDAGQFEAAKTGDAVYSLSLISAGESLAFGTDGGGSATIQVPFTEPVRKTAEVSVMYIGENGAETSIPCVYDRRSHTVTFTTSYFSNYRITVEDHDPDAPCDHSLTEICGAAEASCTQSGWSGETVCLYCGETVQQGETIPAKGHVWGEWNVTTPATEDAEGTEMRACTVCGDQESRSIPKLAHTHKMTAVPKEEATCTEDGTEAYWKCEKCGKLYSDADAVNEITEPVAIPALGHDYEVTVTPPSCTEQGYTTHVCKRCDHSYADNHVDALGHNTEIQNAEDASCTEDGYSGDEVCTVCGETVKIGETILAKGHSWGDWSVTTPATEDSEGEEVRTCGVCGETETHSIPKLPPEPVSNPFADVEQGLYYYDAVIWAVNHQPQITNGTSADAFSPNIACTRGQVVTFLWRAKGCPEPNTEQNPFTDVNADAYYYKAVLWAHEQNITNGTSDHTFQPDLPCTRAHVVTFLWRAENRPAASISNPFSDVPSGVYYTDAVLWAVSRNVTNGISPTSFRPDSFCTRGQIVTFLYRDMKEAQ